MIQQVADQVIVIESGRIVWNSLLSEVPGSLDELFFDLIGTQKPEDLEWLESSQS